MAERSLAKYLNETKTATQKWDTLKQITLVVGNESADLDSVVSAIVYAYYLSEKCKKEDTNNSVVLPVVWCHENDIELRTEVIALFRKFSININDVLFQNQLPPLEKKDLKVVLVDHNHGNEHTELNEHVVKIIDHHEQSDSFPNVKKNIQMVGSCSTLIAQTIHYNNTKFLENFPLLAEFLLSVILVDTFNLDLHSGRTTEQDIFIAEILSSYTEIESDDLFDILQKAKMDISSMSTHNILRKDYKPAQNSLPNKPCIGISSVTMQPCFLLTRKDFLGTAKTYMESLNLDALVIMFLFFGADTLAIRKMAIVSMQDDLRKRLRDFLLKDSDLKLQAEEIGGLNDDLKDVVNVYSHNVKWSRKKMMPTVGNFVKED